MSDFQKIYNSITGCAEMTIVRNCHYKRHPVLARANGIHFTGKLMNCDFQGNYALVCLHEQKMLKYSYDHIYYVVLSETVQEISKRKVPLKSGNLFLARFLYFLYTYSYGV